ncbi:hypothetical protein [Sorangium sp. So ce854]|uniref:hypothetical protein n=1 Tax=Sorangium sp. So ce854 TaxID=3133322 RepID=UPI003F606809
MKICGRKLAWLAAAAAAAAAAVIIPASPAAAAEKPPRVCSTDGVSTRDADRMGGGRAHFGTYTYYYRGSYRRDGRLYRTYDTRFSSRDGYFRNANTLRWSFTCG